MSSGVGAGVAVAIMAMIGGRVGGGGIVGSGVLVGAVD